jgi:TRAP-type transport system small permease protein
MMIIERGVVRLCQALLWVNTTIIFAILAVNVTLRYLTGSSLRWAAEVPEMLFPWLVMAGVVMGAVRGSHITTTFFLDTLSQAWQRRLLMAGMVAVAVAYATLAWATFQMLPIAHDEKSPILGVPGSVTYGCVMFGMGMLSLLSLESAWRLARGLSAFHAAPGHEAPAMNLSS